MSNEVIAQALREYGNAIRGDWSELDGRSVKSQLEEFASALNGDANSNEDINWWRMSAGICPDGGGHWSGKWYGYCETEDGCPSLRDK
jgi:hypothetical protein